MARIPQKPSREGGSVQIRIAGQERGGIGKVGRITNDARDNVRGRGSRRRRRSSYGASGANRSAVLRRWLTLGLVVAGAGICSILVWTLLRQLNPKPAVVATGGDRAPVPTIEATEATALVTRLLEADSTADLAPILRSGGMPAAEALERLDTIREESEGLDDPLWLGGFDSICVPIHFMMVQRAVGSPLLFALTPADEGEWRIDLDATLAACEPEFREWAAGKAAEGLVRVLGKADTYFNGAFADDEAWACFALSHPDDDAVIYGYCRRDGPQFGAIEAIQRRNRRASQSEEATDAQGLFRVTLRLTTPRNAIGRQFEIAEVVADDWVVGGTPLEKLLAERAGAAAE